MKFHRLKVQEKEFVTPDAVALRLEIPDDLKSKFDFKAGQYLTVKTQELGEDVRRSYSICTAQGDDRLRIGVKRVEDGMFSQFACNTIEIGSFLEVLSPTGNFVLKEGYDDQNLLMIAAGSGITPILSHIETALATSSSCCITLIYGNKNPQSAMFRNRLDELKNLYMERLNVVHVFSAIAQEIDLFSGRITGERCRKILKTWVGSTPFDHVFICGPEEMIHDVKAQFEEMGYDPAQVHYELFGTQSPKRKPLAAREDDGTATPLTVILDGVAHQIEMRSGERALEAARRHNIDAPFSCQGGICSTCRCKIIEGEGTMEVNHALEDHEVQNGYALSCQLLPSSPKLVISYDDGH